jgi:hypothetical protein
MNSFAKLFRSKAPSADPPSPCHIERSFVETSLFLSRRITTQSQWGEGEGEGALKDGPAAFVSGRFSADGRSLSLEHPA